MHPRRDVALIRFCTLFNDPHSHSPQGVFQAAFTLREAGLLEGHEEEWLEREMAWLRMHLPSPTCLRESGNERAICWLRPEARHAIDRVRGLATLLDYHGLPVTMVTTNRPGTVVYHDKYQVVAKPFRRRR
jgi:hypothetical protein